MICPPCKDAGRLNADSACVTDETSAEYLRLRALERHGECHGGTWCDCQHRVGPWQAGGRR